MISSFDIEAASRLTLNATTIATFLIAAHWVHWGWTHSKPERLRIFSRSILENYFVVVCGLALKAFGWTIHQMYWYVNWVLASNGLLSMKEAHNTYARPITWLAEALIICATILVMAPYLKLYFGRWWFRVGAGILLLIYLFGLAIGHPKVDVVT